MLMIQLKFDGNHHLSV